MGATLVAPISNLKINVLTIDEILATTGQDVDISEVTFNGDGTFSFQGRRVILHIRDIQPYGTNFTLPKYHLANCDTLQKMWQKNKGGKYVVATRTDGTFLMKFSFDGGATWESKDQRLDVCKNCLTALDWDGYSNVPMAKRPSIFSAFQLSEFFQRYPNSPLTYTADHTDLTKPVNTYGKDFQELSKAYRESVKWRCEECSADLNSAALRRFLHVHHRDGQKNNNSPGNLIALCIECHSAQDDHGHMANSKDLFEYRKLKRSTGGYRVL